MFIVTVLWYTVGCYPTNHNSAWHTAPAKCIQHQRKHQTMPKTCIQRHTIYTVHNACSAVYAKCSWKLAIRTLRPSMQAVASVECRRRYVRNYNSGIWNFREWSLVPSSVKRFTQYLVGWSVTKYVAVFWCSYMYICSSLCVIGMITYDCLLCYVIFIFVRTNINETVLL